MLVDGEPRVACVTPIARVEDRAVTTIEGLDEAVRAERGRAFRRDRRLAVRVLHARASSCASRANAARDVDRSLAAHLCRCTGWLTVRDAVGPGAATDSTRDLDAAARRAALEAGGPQRVDLAVPLGGGVVRRRHRAA